MKSTHHIVAFSGHRSYDGTADKELRRAIESLYTNGARIFRVGMAEGFDLAAGKALLELMDNHDDITIEAHIPYPAFASRFKGDNLLLYDAIIAKARVVRYAGFAYQVDIFHRRNDMLVECATHLIAWWDGTRSGTGYTVNRARRQGCNILNLHPSAEQKLAL